MAKPKRGSIQRLGRGRYRIWYYDEHGRRCSERYNGDERGAYARLDELQDIQPAIPNESAPDGALSVYAFYTDVYHEHLRRRGLAPRTIEGYESQWRLISDDVGSWDMHAIAARQIETYIQNLPTAGQQQAAFKLLRQMFNFAYRLEYIEQNPMTRRIERSMKHDYYQRPTYTANEAKAVLEAISGYEFELAIYLCLLGGLRRSEALGLLWSDVEPIPGGSIIHVSRTWQRKVGTQGIEAPTKTSRSVRSVIIPEPWSQRFDDLRSEPSHGVVAEPRPNPDAVTRSWKAFCEARDLRYVSLQGLRATYSTLLASAGISDALVSDSMGHSVLSTRYRHYLNASQDARTSIANALRDAII